MSVAGIWVSKEMVGGDNMMTWPVICICAGKLTSDVSVKAGTGATTWPNLAVATGTVPVLTTGG